MKETITDMEKLRSVALEQHGYVTSAQALDVGVSYPALSYFVKNGRLERAARGVYRVPQIPYTEHDLKHLALLWASSDNAVLGFDTALSAYEVCDINPSKIHVVVPKRTRINKTGGERFVVHKADIPENEIGWWEGMPIVQLPVAIKQCLTSGVPSYLISQAISFGVTKNLLTDREASELYKLLKAR